MGDSDPFSSRCLFCGAAGGQGNEVRMRIVTVSHIFVANIACCESCGGHLARKVKDAIVEVYELTNPKRSILL